MKNKNGPTSLLLIAFLSFIAIGLPSGLLGVAWVYIQATFNISLEALGLMLATSTIGRLISTFVSGRLMARLGSARVLLAGSLICVLGLSGFIVAPSWPFLLVSAFVLGMGNGVIDAGVNTFVAAHYSASRLNWLHACFGIGLTFGPPTVTWIVIDMGLSWRWGYGVGLVVQLALAACFLITLKQWELDVDSIQAEGTPVKKDARISDTLRLPVVWLSLLMFFFYGGVEIGAGQLTNSLFIEGRGIDARTSAFWISVYWGSYTVGRMLIGVVVDRVSTRTVVRMAMLAAVVGSAMIGLNLSDTFSFAGLALLGFALAPQFPTLISETPRLVGIQHTANTIGFQLGATGVGASILIGFAGVLAEKLTLEIVGPFLLVVSIITFILHEARLLVKAE